VLKPTSQSFSLIFDVPAGSLGSDEQGSYGLALDLFQETSAIAAVAPEPGTATLLGLGVLGLAGYAMLRPKRAAPR
jgi:hypothetical protein